MFALTACVTIIFKCRRGILGCLQCIHMKHWGILLPYLKMKNKLFWIFWASGACLKYAEDGENPILFPPVSFPFRLFVDKMKRWRFLMRAVFVLCWSWTSRQREPIDQLQAQLTTALALDVEGCRKGSKWVSSEIISRPSGRYEPAGVEGAVL